MTKKFPKKIYVRWEQPSNDEAYLAAGEDMYGMVEVGGKTVIATYQLVGWPKCCGYTMTIDSPEEQVALAMRQGDRT